MFEQTEKGDKLQKKVEERKLFVHFVYIAFSAFAGF
jgi:hypothetical protein